MSNGWEAKGEEINRIRNRSNRHHQRCLPNHHVVRPSGWCGGLFVSKRDSSPALRVYPTGVMYAHATFTSNKGRKCAVSVST